MKRLLETLRRVAFALALIAFLAMVSAFVAERTGWLARRIEERLSRELGEPVRLDGAHVEWFARALELRGLRLEQDPSQLWIAELGARIGRRALGLTLEELELRGGRLELSPRLLEKIQRIAAAREPAGEERAPWDRGLPELAAITVRDLQIDLEHPEWGELPIGLTDLLWTRDADGKPRIEGRIVPELAQGGDTSEVYLSGHELEPGLIEVSGSTAGVSLTVDTLREGTALEEFRRYAPNGRLALDGHLRFWLDGREPPSGEVRASLSGGVVQPPGLSSPVEELRVELRAAYEPAQPLAAHEAWSGLARLQGSFRGAPIEGWAIYGGSALPRLAGRAWLRCRDLALDEETFALLELDRRGLVKGAFAALDPRGRVADVVVAAELSPPETGGSEGERIEAVLEIAADGGLGIAYHGWPNTRGERQGVPLPVQAVRGSMLALHAPRMNPPRRLAFFDVQGEHSSGRIPGGQAWAEGLIAFPGKGRGARFDIAYGARGVPVDGELERALGGLRGAGFIWPTFAPAGGSVTAFDARMLRTDRQSGIQSRFAFELDGLSAVYAALPVPLDDLRGRLELHFDGRRGSAAAFALEGRTSTSDHLTLRGRLQDDPSAGPAGPPAMDGIREVEVRVANVALRGADRDALVAALPAIGAALEEAGPAGKVDVLYRASQPGPAAALVHGAEITPREVQFSPQRFKLLTRNARGRVLVSARGGLLRPAGRAEGSSAAEVRVQPLVGEWPGGTLVALAAEFDGPGSGRMQLVSAGVDPSNRGLLGAFGEAFPSKSGGARTDLSVLDADGRVDLTGEVVLRPGEEPLTLYRIFLRDNALGAGSGQRFSLSGLTGVLEQRDGQLYGEDIKAMLGRTPIVLETAALAVDEHGSYRMTLAPRAQGLPIDREHVGSFLNDAAVETLIGELGWSGALDVSDALLSITGVTGEEGRLEFEGRLAPHGMTIDLGLPLEIDSAAVDVEQFVYEDGQARAWMNVRDLDGRVADRRLADAHLSLTYVEPRLSVLDLSGRFEQGLVRNFTGQTAGPCFSIDLEDPFPFELAVRLSEVDVAGLLRGIHESEFASRGLLSGELRLGGDLDHLTGIRGEGRIELRESSLWSIPVVRDLFSQLGFDQTAVFEEMRAQFRLREGVIEMDPMQVKSPLLKLVGKGTLDLDGRLHHDLQVQYSLVDKLGPFTRWIYFIQNNLLSVSVRGDMSRPKIVLHGALSFLQRLRAGQRRELPLPGFAPLPARF